LQTWAEQSGNESKAGLFDRAIRGDQRDARTQKNLVWGWGKIAKETAPYQKFREIFHQARYNLALCRLLQAQSKQDDERLLTMAEKDIFLTKRLYGLGGNRWLPQYDALLKRIQRIKGDPPIGVKALEAPIKVDE